mmetsp:Transcript_54535/g.145559  ORF Transcript_54535/g.145559 Transcript_54535/m.145559 type:complete len:311 (-) Transcript_54535:1563-2495(-)
MLKCLCKPLVHQRLLSTSLFKALEPPKAPTRAQGTRAAPTPGGIHRTRDVPATAARPKYKRQIRQSITEAPTVQSEVVGNSAGTVLQSRLLQSLPVVHAGIGRRRIGDGQRREPPPRRLPGLPLRMREAPHPEQRPTRVEVCAAKTSTVRGHTALARHPPNGGERSLNHPQHHRHHPNLRKPSGRRMARLPAAASVRESKSLWETSGSASSKRWAVVPTAPFGAQKPSITWTERVCPLGSMPMIGESPSRTCFAEARRSCISRSSRWSFCWHWSSPCYWMGRTNRSSCFVFRAALLTKWILVLRAGAFAL